MEIDLTITIIIAVGGWAFGIYQMFKNRQWEKKDLLANRRYEEYSRFMRKLEQINESVRKDPNLVFGVSNDFIATLLEGDEESMEKALLTYNQRIIDYIRTSTEPLLIINQE